MLVKSEFVINNKICYKLGTVGGLEVYQYREKQDTEVTLYFTKNNEVLKAIKITAECGQNMGYVDELTLIKKEDLS